MGTRTDKALTVEDLERYVSDRADFTFELNVLKKCNDLSFECEHGGTYRDPATGKNRQFDIRALRTLPDIRIRFAIECKNIRDTSPIIAHCTPRTEFESRLDAACAKHYLTNGKRKRVPGAVIRSLHQSRIIFPREESVCKSLSQAWEEEINRKDKVITGRDDEIYDRWSQAISSCCGLVEAESQYYQDNPQVSAECYSVIIPILVVPTGTLWQTRFGNDGTWSGSVENVPSVSMYIGKSLKLPEGSFVVSHLEVVTLGGFKDFCTRLLSAFNPSNNF